MSHPKPGTPYSGSDSSEGKGLPFLSQIRTLPMSSSSSLLLPFRLFSLCGILELEDRPWRAPSSTKMSPSPLSLL